MRAADTLQQALTTLSYRLSAAHSLPKALAAGGALYAPARRLEGSHERLQDTIKGRYVPLRYTDIRDLDLAWRRAATAVGHAHWTAQRRMRSTTDGATPATIALR